MVSNEKDRILGVKAPRRTVLKGATGAAAGLAAAGIVGKSAQSALAQDDVKSQILAIPGAGKGQPTEQDMQKVGEICIDPTKANVQQGEFNGVELTFMGLNNQNLHDIVFRNLLTSFVDYTGVKINWIDLAQADYNPRLQQAIATKTIDFDVVEMGAPYEGDVCGAGLASVMPDWVKEQIDMSDYVGYLQPPVGTWDGKTYRVSIDGDCHNFNYRTDYFGDADLASAWTSEGNQGEWAVPKTYQQVQAVTKFLKGKQVGGQDAYGWLDVCKPGGGFSWYFFASRATAYAKHPDDKAWLFDADTMKPRINNPAFVRAIQDVIDALPSEPADQINADLNVTGFSEFLGGTGSMCAWWGDVGSNVYTNDQSVVQDKVGFDILPGSDDVYNSKTGAVGHAFERPELRAEHGVPRMGRLRDGAGRQRSSQAKGGLERRGIPGRERHLALARRVPIGLPAVPKQPLQRGRLGGHRVSGRVRKELPRLRAEFLQPPECGDRATDPGYLPVLQRC